MHPALKRINHRPWPLPSGQWIWQQHWLDLAFIHFEVDADALEDRLPSGLKLDLYDGKAWLGLVPFRMAGVTRRQLPDMGPFSTFPELNLRTYVEADGKPGVWFLSLDADSLPMVCGGRLLYKLPYFWAGMSHDWQNDWCCFSSERHFGKASFSVRYRPTGPVFQAKTGSFAHWATERYCLYSATPSRQVKRVEVHHVPWSLQSAEVDIQQSNILETAGFEPLSTTPLCLFSRGVEVVSYPQRARARAYSSKAPEGLPARSIDWVAEPNESSPAARNRAPDLGGQHRPMH